MKEKICAIFIVLLMIVITGTFVFSVALALAADQEQTQEQEQIYGSQLMTQQERLEYRAKMRAAETDEERDRIRREHHELMKERAKEQGVTLPDEPPERGMGGGMGPGGRNR